MFIDELSNHLEGFSWTSKDVGNCRCPICGDSKTKASKRRGYFISNGSSSFYKCHNCEASMGLGSFIKLIDDGLYRKYIKEIFKDHRSFDYEFEKPKEKEYTFSYSNTLFNSSLNHVEKISDLEDDHPARVYIKNRQIPDKFFDIIYYSDNYKKWVNDYLIEDKFNKEFLEYPDNRIIFPLISENGNVFGVSGRSINPNDKLRYISINIDKTLPTIYGLERVDLTRDVYVVEGQIDSLFLPNCIAATGSNLKSLSKFDTSRFILIYDNEPRNKEICRTIQAAIKDGFRVVIWHESIEGKDINEMINKGLSQKEVLTFIRDNVYSGLHAQLKFNNWKKI